MICYNENTKTFYLETEATSYIIRVLADGSLNHCYYGKKISRDDMSFYNLFRGVSFSVNSKIGDATVSPEVCPRECGTFGRGDYRTPSIVVENQDGRRVNELVYKDFVILDGKPSFNLMPQLDAVPEDCSTLAITLVDIVNGFEAVLYYSVFEKENIIARRSVVTNISEGPLKIISCASFSFDIERNDLQLLTLEGAWGRERYIEQYPLHHGVSSIESRRGASSHHMNPFAALLTPDADEDNGEVYAAALVYSGDFKIIAELSHSDTVRFQGGLNPETFSWCLPSGDSFISPEALLTYSAAGLHGMSLAFHTACRHYLGKSAEKNLRHPIVINSWEAMYFNITEQKFLDFISDCKGLGIDTVVLDDGWFGHRTNDNSSLGDWFVNRNIFPNGLYKIVDHCKANNMNFGIWFEPEMISEDSELYKAHPDWCIHIDGMKPIESRQQLVLDMSRREVCDAIYEQVAAILNEYDISYVKWDMNRHITDNGSATLSPNAQGEHSHRYILGVYYLMNRLIKDFPHIFFEGCSGGGGRFDFGILYYMPQIWTSDDTDAIERLKIQYGTSLVYPTSSMVAHVSACPNHTVGRNTSFSVRGDVAHMCNFGYELHVGDLSSEEKEMIKEQTAKHRELDPMIQNGEFYRLRNPFNSNTCAWQFVSRDGKKSYVDYVRVNAIPNYKPEYLRLKGLDAAATYRVEPLGVTVSGDTLMNAGIPMLLNAWCDYVSMTYDISIVD